MPTNPLLIIAASEIDSNLYYATSFLAPDAFIYLKTEGDSVLLMSDLEMDRAKAQARVNTVLSYSAYEERAKARLFHLLTMKPVLYVLNRKSGAVNIDAEGGERWRELKDFLDSSHAQYVFVDAGVENELSDVHGDEKADFRRELGVSEDGINALIKAGYALLDLISFFTTGEDESRAWTITRGSPAPEAGAAIHTDFRDKFIRAETISWNKLLEATSWASARDKGWIRSEGKEYVVADGDVLEFKHG